MAAVDRILPTLTSGERLSREEFLRRWELLPQIKKAELIGGVVYLPSPISIGHSVQDNMVALWLGYYAAHTPGCQAESNGTWLMQGDAPQPDDALLIRPEYGGQSRVQGNYLEGAPELAAEICLSSASHDLGPKLDLYRAAGVQEYVALVLEPPRVFWRRLVKGRYVDLETGADELLRSQVFPGLWLDSRAALANDAPRVLEALQLGLQSAEHQQFVQKLAARKL